MSQSCKICHTLVVDTSRFCPRCGTPVFLNNQGNYPLQYPQTGQPAHIAHTIICPRCGIINDAAIQFCGNCGYSLGTPNLQELGSPRNPLKAPAIGLIVIGIVQGLFSVFILIYTLQLSNRVYGDDLLIAVLLTLNTISLLSAPFVVFGGLQMLKAKNYTICLIASIVSMLCSFFTTCLIFPFALWVFIVLLKSNGKAAFENRAYPPQ